MKQVFREEEHVMALKPLFSTLLVILKDESAKEIYKGEVIDEILPKLRSAIKIKNKKDFVESISDIPISELDKDEIEYLINSTMRDTFLKIIDKNLDLYKAISLCILFEVISDFFDFVLKYASARNELDRALDSIFSSIDKNNLQQFMSRLNIKYDF